MFVLGVGQRWLLGAGPGRVEGAKQATGPAGQAGPLGQQLCELGFTAGWARRGAVLAGLRRKRGSRLGWIWIEEKRKDSPFI